MNSKKCKQLRKMIYGDISHRVERTYLTIGHTVTEVVPGKDGLPVKRKFIANQTINHSDSPRSKYLKAKDNYKAQRRKEKDANPAKHRQRSQCN